MKSIEYDIETEVQKRLMEKCKALGISIFDTLEVPSVSDLSFKPMGIGDIDTPIISREAPPSNIEPLIFENIDWGDLN